MDQWTPEQVSELLSSYIDGALEPHQASEVEAYVATHPEASRELKELRRMKHLLASKQGPAPNPYFWTRVSAGLESRKREEENLLPFPRKYMPAATVLGFVAVLAVGLAVFQQRGPLLDYFSRTSQRVQKAYETGWLRGSILPLFGNIGKDEVLQFAMFGTLPLDEKSETALRVDERSERGYRIDVGLTAGEKTAPVTVDDFMKEVRPTVSQAEMIDSVLESARQRIGSAAFYAENNALAIDPELTRLNKVVIANIAAVLAPIQRARFDRFLEKRNASYAVTAARMREPVGDEPSFREVPRTGERDYIVVTPESLLLAPLGVDFERRARIEAGEMTPGMTREFHIKLEKLMRPSVRPRIAVSPPGGHAPLRIVGAEDFFQIQIEPMMPEFNEESLGVWVAPRPRRSKVFKFEYRMSEEGVQVFETRIERKIQAEMDSMLRRLSERGAEHEEAMRKFDSLWNVRAPGYSRPRVPRRGARPDSVRVKEESSVRMYRLDGDSTTPPTVRVTPPTPNIQPKSKKKLETPIDT